MNINTIVIHCSDSPPGRKDDAETIHQWHLQRNFDGIGYQYVIIEDGEVQAGRPEYWVGAHVKGHNAGSIGICLIGIDQFTPAQFDSLAELIDDVTSRHPIKTVVGHGQIDISKTCPNFDVSAFVARLSG